MRVKYSCEVRYVSLRNAFISASPLIDLVPFNKEESNYYRQRKGNWCPYIHLRPASTPVLRLGASHSSSFWTSTVGYWYLRRLSVPLQSRPDFPNNSTNLTWCSTYWSNRNVDWLDHAYHSSSRATRRLWLWWRRSHWEERRVMILLL